MRLRPTSAASPPNNAVPCAAAEPPVAIAGLGEPRAASAVEARQDRRRVKELERELYRKDKALAEAVHPQPGPGPCNTSHPRPKNPQSGKMRTAARRLDRDAQPTCRGTVRP